ncbi:MAG: secreted metal-binding protein [uncultured bacterium]|nr:MAG: secreted metal-binding protein [uncultured bacterium]
MNEKNLGLVVLIVIGIGGFFVYTNMKNKSTININSTTGATPTGAATKTQSTSIEIKNFKHSPNRLTIKAGATVSVTNRDIVGHTVTSDTAGIFDTGLIGKDETKTFLAPETPGEYKYHCTPHPNMTGVLVVE